VNAALQVLFNTPFFMVGLKGAKDIKDSAFSEDPIVEYFCSIFDVMTSTHCSAFSCCSRS
jgi:hypothetical protein